TGGLLREYDHPDEVGALALSADGRRLAAASGVALKADAKAACVSVWEVATGRLCGRYPGGGLVKTLAPTPDGNALLAGRMSGPAVYLECGTGRRLELGGEERQTCAGVAFLDGGRTLLVCRSDRLSWWDAATGRRAREIALDPQRIIWQAAVSPDGRLLYAGGPEGLV